MTTRIRKMSSLVSPTVLSFVAGLKEATKHAPVQELKVVRSQNGNLVAVDQLGREVTLVVPSRQAPAETDNAKRFCEVLYGEGNVTVQKVK
jgi:hypothetical protein